MKKILSVAAVVVILLVCLCGCAEQSGYPTATNEFYVNDFADVITVSVRMPFDSFA